MLLWACSFLFLGMCCWHWAVAHDKTYWYMTRRYLSFWPMGCGLAAFHHSDFNSDVFCYSMRVVFCHSALSRSLGQNILGYASPIPSHLCRWGVASLSPVIVIFNGNAFCYSRIFAILLVALSHRSWQNIFRFDYPLAAHLKIEVVPNYLLEAMHQYFYQPHTRWGLDRWCDAGLDRSFQNDILWKYFRNKGWEYNFK